MNYTIISTEDLRIANAVNEFSERCHTASYDAGWWKDLTSGTDLRDELRRRTRFGIALGSEKLMLAVTELAETMEGWRKGLMDDKLPHRKMIEVEIADAFIRLGDLAKALELDVGGAIVEKMAFNAVRLDHKIEHRMAAGGKAA